MTVRIDPELQALIPPLSAEERARLEANLLEEGCREALVVWAGESPIDPAHPCQIPWVRQLSLKRMSREVTWLCPTCGEVRQRPYVLLDGHHRYPICQRHEIPFTITEAPAWVKTREEASIWIIQNQLGRRNLEVYQRIELAERLRPLLEQQAKEKQHAGGREKVPQTFAQPGETRQAIADLAGVSRETVRKAEIIVQEADEPIKQALRRRERSIQSVYQELRPPRPQPTASVNDEGSTVLPPSARVGPDTSVDPQALAVPVTARRPGHETTETAVESPQRCDGPSIHQEDLGAPAHRCLTLMGELYAELQAMEDLHDMVFICQGWSQQTRAGYLHQCRSLINKLQAIEHALQTPVANKYPALGGMEDCHEADPTPDDSGARNEPTRDGLGGHLGVRRRSRNSNDSVGSEGEPEGGNGHSPVQEAGPNEPSDISHAAVTPTGSMATVGTTASS
jgi:hypothetical protein